MDGLFGMQEDGDDVGGVERERERGGRGGSYGTEWEREDHLEIG